MAGDKPKVVVIGGIYVDMAIRCVDFPATGQIAAGSGFSYTASGAGSNQAIQAALCGCDVYLVGKVGKDIFGQMIKDNLEAFGVNCDFVSDAEAKNTGVSVSFVNSSGANRTIISEGTNRALQNSDIEEERFEKLLRFADVCLINGGLSNDFICGAIRAAKLAQTKVILDPALSGEQFENQSGKLPLDYYTADILVPNFAEAAELSTAQNHNIHTAKLIGSDLIARGVGCVVIKLGRKGAMVIDKSGADHIAPFEVKFVDHTGCGDAFDGALAASCGVGSAKGCLTADEIRRAAKFASAAGALACSKFGSQESLPKKEEIIELLQSLP
ncbi:MAG: PfkB family carbohydrate kinase [Phycisphaerae bacterium]|jgi:ribokinase